MKYILTKDEFEAMVSRTDFQDAVAAFDKKALCLDAAFEAVDTVFGANSPQGLEWAKKYEEILNRKRVEYETENGTAEAMKEPV